MEWHIRQREGRNYNCKRPHGGLCQQDQEQKKPETMIPLTQSSEVRNRQNESFLLGVRTVVTLVETYDWKTPPHWGGVFQGSMVFSS